MSISLRTSSSETLPTLAKFPLPPKVIVPIVRTETIRPELPNCLYSIARSSFAPIARGGANMPAWAPPRASCHPKREQACRSTAFRGNVTQFAFHPLQERNLGLCISPPPRWRRPPLRWRARRFGRFGRPGAATRWHGRNGEGPATRVASGPVARRPISPGYDDRIRLADLPALRSFQQGDSARV